MAWGGRYGPMAFTEPHASPQVPGGRVTLSAIIALGFCIILVKAIGL